MSVDILEFLKSWWKNHICGTDKEYKSFFESEGVVD